MEWAGAWTATRRTTSAAVRLTTAAPLTTSARSGDTRASRLTMDLSNPGSVQRRKGTATGGAAKAERAIFRGRGFTYHTLPAGAVPASSGTMRIIGTTHKS